MLTDADLEEKVPLVWSQLVDTMQVPIPQYATPRQVRRKIRKAAMRATRLFGIGLVLGLCYSMAVGL